MTLMEYMEGLGNHIEEYVQANWPDDPHEEFRSITFNARITRESTNGRRVAMSYMPYTTPKRPTSDTTPPP